MTSFILSWINEAQNQYISTERLNLNKKKFHYFLFAARQNAQMAQQKPRK